MPAQPLNADQIEDAKRLKAALAQFQASARNGGYAPISATDGAEIVAALQGVMSGAVE